MSRPVQRDRVRVVHVLLTMDVGGLERVALDLCRLVDPTQFDCRIICVRQAGAMAPLARANGVPLEALGARGALSGILRLARQLRRLRPHVVHSHNPGSHRVAVPARLVARAPVLVHTKHGRNSPDDPRAVATNRRLARLTDVIVAVSQDAAEVAAEIEGISAAKVRVIHNGVELGEPLSPSLWASCPPRAITVARLDPVKDQATMLHAARKVADARPSFKLDIVGDGPSLGGLKALANSLGLTSTVSFLGYHQDVRPLLLRPQIFLLSSVSEGIALTLLEAMAAGLPAVATDVGGNREVVLDGFTGYLVPPRDPEALAAKVLALLDDPVRLQAAGAAARARVALHFDLRATASRYADLYLRLVWPSPPDSLGVSPSAV